MSKRYLLWRIIGNDIPPRHTSTQSVDNLRFILEHEEAFEDCDKAFLFNRVVNEVKLDEMRGMVLDAGYKYISIPFRPSEFRACKNDPQRRHYLTNVNLARNEALMRRFAYECCLPLDGGCYFHPAGWANLDVQVRINPGRAFFVVPMSRVKTHDEVLAEKPPRCIRETYTLGEAQVCGATEPQIAFCEGSDIMFDDTREYGQCDKAEVLWRLGVPGPWDHWNPRDRREALKRPSEHFGQVLQAGWVFRLPSGNAEADFDNVARGESRKVGVRRLTDAARACSP